LMVHIIILSVMFHQAEWWGQGRRRLAPPKIDRISTNARGGNMSRCPGDDSVR
jgi:hypothetical protein